jgi:hypothetical protein
MILLSIIFLSREEPLVHGMFWDWLARLKKKIQAKNFKNECKGSELLRTTKSAQHSAFSHRMIP